MVTLNFHVGDITNSLLFKEMGCNVPDVGDKNGTMRHQRPKLVSNKFCL